MARTFNRQLVLPLVALLPMVLAAGNEIQEYDPTQYAEVGRRIFESGDWIHLRDNFGPYHNKPPVTFWLMSGSFRLFGLNPFAVRFPVILLGILLCWATYRIGRALYDPRTGAIAAGFVGSSLAFQLMVADPKIDMGVTAFIAWAICMFLEARERPWKAHLGWVFVGLGLLTKGPIALATPALALLPEALRRVWGRPSERGSPWARLAPFKPLAAPAILGVLVVPWLYQSYREWGSEGPGFLLWEQSFGRLFARTYRNHTTALFFVHTLLWAFLPFTPLFLFALYRRARDWRAARLALPPSEERVLWWWFALTFVGISASSYKLPQYVYWLTPPAALLSARVLVQQVVPSPRALRFFTALPQALIVAGAAVAGLLLWKVFPGSPLWLGVFVITWAAAMVLRRRLEPALGVASLAVASTLGFHLFFHGHFYRELLQFQPGGRFGERARHEDPQAPVLPFYRAAATQSAAFAARRDTVDAELPELVQLVTTHQVNVAVVSPEAIPELERQGLEVQRLLDLPSYPTSRPSRAFLLASTRSGVVEQQSLVRLSPTQLGRLP